MGVCVVDRCEESVAKKGHSLCYLHWQAEKEGELTECRSCGCLKEDAKPLCSSCFKEKKASPSPQAASSPRKAGQGAREMALELAKRNPLGMFLSKWSFGIFRAPELVEGRR